MIKCRLRKQSLQNDLPSVQQWHLLTKMVLLLALAIGLASNVGYSQELDFLTPLSPAATLALRSQDGNTPTSIVFVNDYDKEIVVYWVNYTGHLVFYNFLAPNDFYIQQTYLTHPWIVYDQATGLPIEGFLPIAREAIALVGKPAISNADKQQCAADQAISEGLSQALSLLSTATVEDLPISLLIEADAKSFEKLASAQEQCTLDPPDKNYTTIAQPIITLPPAVKPTGNVITSAEATAINELNTNLATAYGVLNAAITSANRALGAAEAGSKQWQIKQAKMAKHYINWYQKLAPQEQGLVVQLRRALTAAGLPTDF
jgi:VHL beta domain